MTVTDDAQSRTEQDDTERGTVSEGGRAKKSVSGFGSWGDWGDSGVGEIGEIRELGRCVESAHHLWLELL